MSDLPPAGSGPEAAEGDAQRLPEPAPPGEPSDREPASAESGVVTVYEGRPEFRALERAARRAGIGKRRLREYLPYRMLEVEVAANAVYGWAAEQVLARRLLEERPSAPGDYARAVRHEAQALRHRAHEKLMRAFLDPAVFDGRVRVREESGGAQRESQLSLEGS